MKLKIHMKSGKTLSQRGVKSYKIRWDDHAITGIEFTLKWWAKTTVIVSSLDLGSIEAITK